MSDEAASAPAIVGRGETVISVREASVWYGQVIGINDISLEIGAGVIGLLGPNGAGKSTLLKCLTAQLRPRSGGVRLFGEPIRPGSALMARVGFVPEQDAFYEEMSARAFVRHLTELQGFEAKEADERAMRALTELDLAPRADDPIRGFSKGMRQRVKIAQAIAHDPELLFLDEPLTGTDPVGRRRIIDLVRGWGEAGRCVLVSSHILHEVEQMTSDVVMIHRGRVIADGDVASIRSVLSNHPHRVAIECAAPRQLAALVIASEHVNEVTFRGAGVEIATKDPDACYDQLGALFVERPELGLRAMRSPGNDLETIFKHLVG